MKVIGEWLSEWNTPGTLGDVVPWAISSAFAVLAVVVTRRGKQREQALAVTAWVEQLADGRTVARVRNSSRDRIEAVGVMLGIAADRGDADSASQCFTTEVIGPERSVDFPVEVSDSRLKVRLYFTDRAGRSWIYTEHGGLKRSWRLPSDFFHGLNTGPDSNVTDHAPAQDGSNITPLGRLPVSRMDLTGEDGTNVTITFMPQTGHLRPSTVVELTRQDDRKFARVYLDEFDHILAATICHLPSDTRTRSFPKYGRTDKYALTFFGPPGMDLRDGWSQQSLDEAIPLGGMHATMPELGYVAYDKKGHLTCIVLHLSALHPDFLDA